MNRPALVLRRARAEDAALLFEWANEPQVRRMAFSPGPIAWPEHCAWLSRKLADERCRLYVATDAGGTPLGQMRLDLEPGGIAVVSLSVDARERGRGVGKQVIGLAVAEAVRLGRVAELHAHVRAENAASLAAFLASGFGAPTPLEYRGAQAVRLVRKLFTAAA